MSIVLIAVMLDRPALTMRNVALAALAILIVAPESLFDPSFEMSFAAVIGLVALYEWLSERERARPARRQPGMGKRCAEARASSPVQPPPRWSRARPSRLSRSITSIA